MRGLFDQQRYFNNRKRQRLAPRSVDVDVHGLFLRRVIDVTRDDRQMRIDLFVFVKVADCVGSLSVQYGAADIQKNTVFK